MTVSYAGVTYSQDCRTVLGLKYISLTKQPTFCNTTTGLNYILGSDLGCQLMVSQSHDLAPNLMVNQKIFKLPNNSGINVVIQNWVSNLIPVQCETQVIYGVWESLIANSNILSMWIVKQNLKLTLRVQRLSFQRKENPRLEQPINLHCLCITFKSEWSKSYLIG